MRKALIRLLAALVAAYIAVCLALFLAQRSLLFPAPPPLPVQPPAGAQMVTLTIPGATVPMFWTALPDAPLVLFFHGNGGQLARSVPTSETATHVGLGFAAVEYPGYGEATGEGPSEIGILAAARAGAEHLAKLGLPRPVCVGHSLGTGVAVAMAAERRCSAVVLASAYTSIPDVAALTYPFVPVHALVRDPFDSRARAAEIHVPTLLLHGSQDTQIPPAIGEALADAILDAKFELVARAHNDMIDEAFWVRVKEFVGG